MAKIYSYTKHINALTSIVLILPSIEGRFIGTELCTLDDVTYVSIPDTAVLPEQRSEIAASVQLVTLTDALKLAIKTASSHVDLINTQVVEKIRLKYSADDEIKALRLAPSATTDAWKAYADECVLWGMERKAALGL